VPFGILPWFYLYLVADVTILCAFALALGAACSSPQDAQSLAIVLISPVMIPLLIMVPILKQPNGVLATAASLFPPFTPMLMLLRQTMPGSVPAWQPWVGLIGVAACAIGTVWLSGRIFRVGILLQGKPPKVAELLRWAVRG
jgi:ABC-2 type transport system permease protein